MKNGILIFISFLLISALNAETFVIRFDQPNAELLRKFTLAEYDIASFKPGEYLDLVVNRPLYDELLREGYNVRITQTEAQLKANLNEETELDGYQDYAEMLAALQSFESAYPNICKLYNIGDSRGKQYSAAGLSNYDDFVHDIWALKVSDNVEDDEDEPAIYYVATHHAREPISLEVVMTLLDHILSNYGSDPTITDNVNSSEIWFVPLVNPDGHKVVTDETNIWWRKNICDNNGNGIINVTGYYANDGVDPNRNYGYQWGGASNSWTSETFQGTEPFSEPETQAVRDLMAQRHFVAGLSYHSYGELILYPYGYADGILAPDQAALADLAVAMSQVLPGQFGGNYTPQPAWALYPCTGTTDDYAYGTHGIFGFTVELATEFIPPASQVAQICDDNVAAGLLILNRVNYSSLRGHITDADTGDPVVAEIFISGVDDTGEYRNPYLSNEDFGSYYRLLTNGDYDVSFYAYGYDTYLADDVNINSADYTVLDVALQPASADITVSGIVTDAASGLPLADAVVSISGFDIPAVTTNIYGEYEISELYSFPYDFLVYANNYASYSENIYVDETNNEIDFSLALLDDGTFENGLLGMCWQFDGNADWYLDNSTANSGTFSIRSGNIGHNQTTDIMVSLFTETEREISFAYKVSSEATYDFLKFFIDDQLQEQWSGNVGWQTAAFDVPAGNHTFRWQYYKDAAVSNGSDCAWLDDIAFPVSDLIVTPLLLEFMTLEACTEGLEFAVINNGANVISLDNITVFGTEFPWFIDDMSISFPYLLQPAEQLDFLVKIDFPVDNEQREILNDELLIESDDCNKVISILFDSDLWVGSEDVINPNVTEFMGNYPNPFNPSTTFKFSLADESRVKLHIYNIKGQRVAKLLDKKLTTGIHTIQWEGKDDNNKAVSSGIYFSTMEAFNDDGDYTSVKKVIILK